MIKLLKIIAIFLFCRLVWIWIDRCGADLGLGETLPFCIECSGITTLIRLILLALAMRFVLYLLQRPPAYNQLYGDDIVPVRTYRVYWHRIAFLLGILTYPLWVWWIDKNTIIPGPDAVWLIRESCLHPGFKGTLLWGVVLLFIVWVFKTLHVE